MLILYFTVFLFSLLNREKLFYKYDYSGMYIFHLRAVRHSDNDISVSKYYFDQYYERIYSFGIVDCSLYSLSFACIWFYRYNGYPKRYMRFVCFYVVFTFCFQPVRVFKNKLWVYNDIFKFKSKYTRKRRDNRCICNSENIESLRHFCIRRRYCYRNV